MQTTTSRPKALTDLIQSIYFLLFYITFNCFTVENGIKLDCFDKYLKDRRLRKSPKVVITSLFQDLI